MPAHSFRDYRLPRGNHGLSRAQVAENQRWRLLGAASELLAERRLAGVSSRLIARRAGVSSHTFYEHFENVDDVLAAAFSNAAQLLVESTGAAFAAHNEPEAAWRAALVAALTVGTEEPGLAALMRIELAVAVPAIGAGRERMVGRLAGFASAGNDGLHERTRVRATLGVAVEPRRGTEPKTTADLSQELATLLA